MIFLILLALPTVLYVIWDSVGVLLSIIDTRRQRGEKENTTKNLPPIAILYPTSDDFDPSACETLLKQVDITSDLFILDDSTSPEEKKSIDNWVSRQSTKIIIVRRPNREGFKGGNINNWLKQYGNPKKYPFFLLIDADEHLPPTFTKDLLRKISDTHYAFVQGLHFATGQLKTFFQKTLNLQVAVDQLFQLPAWNYKGVAPLIGHGVILRTEHVQAVGGFPNVVSEDLALSIALAEKGLSGRVVPNVIGQEIFPKDYRTYWRRRRRWVQADTEMLRKFMHVIWQSSLNIRAKISLSVRELRLPILTTYWLLCAVLALQGILGVTGRYTVSPWWWLGAPLLFFPSWPALSLSTYSFGRRLLYLFLLPVVGTSSSGITPLAVLTGFKKQLRFDPTGSRTIKVEQTLDMWFMWELLSGILFLGGGILGHNTILVAIGLALFASPFLRTKAEVPLLALVTVVFWLILMISIIFSFIQGEMPLEQLLLLVGLTIM